MAEYIEREALIAHIKDLPTWWADDGGVYGRSMKYPEGMFDCEDVVSSVENAPAADVAPVVHGRWVTPHWHNSDYCYNCSKCGGEAMHRECQWARNGIYPICPNCGAKMDGGTEYGTAL